MTCPAVIEVVTPGPPGPPGDSSSSTIAGPAVLGRAEATPGFAVALPLGTGLSIVGGALTATGATNLGYDPATRLLSSSTGTDVTIPLVNTTAAGLVPHTWLTGAEAATLEHIHGNIAGEVYEHVKAGASLSALTPYRIIGGVGDTDRVEVVAADAGNSNTMPASGILPGALASNADGHGTVAGVITGVNTAAYPSGTVLYVAVGGGLTATKPSANVQMVAVVGRQHASTGTVVPLIGPSLARVAYTGSYGDLLNSPIIPSTPGEVGAATAAQGAKADTAVQPAALASYVQTGDSRLTDAREWIAATVEQVEAEAGTETTRRAWTAQRVRQAIAAWWTGASTAAGRALVTAVDAAAQRAALALSSADSPQFTGVGLGVAPRTGYAAALGSGVLPRAQIVTVAGSTYTCDIRAANRFMLSAAIAGNTTIAFSNVSDLAVADGFAEYVEVQVDFRYTSGVITIQASGFATTWDNNIAATPTAGEIETLIVQITPAVTGTPFSTATVYVAPMRGRT